MMREKRICDIVGYQSCKPMAESEDVREFADRYRELPYEVICELYYIGYIEGKRAERKRKAVSSGQ